MILGNVEASPQPSAQGDVQPDPTSRTPSSSASADRRTRRRPDQRRRVDGATGPLQRRLVLFVIGIGDDLQELGIAVNTPQSSGGHRPWPARQRGYSCDRRLTPSLRARGRAASRRRSRTRTSQAERASYADRRTPRGSHPCHPGMTGRSSESSSVGIPIDTRFARPHRAAGTREGGNPAVPER